MEIMDSVNYTQLIIIPLSTGLVSSIVFLIFLFNIRPSIDISNQICKRKNGETGSKFTIKIINKSLFSMYDVKMDLLFVTPYNVGSGTNAKTRVIKLSSNELFHIPCKRKSNEYAGYAVLVNTYEDIDKIWNGEHTKLEFQLSARHSLSGFSKVFVKHYSDKDVHLTEGKFEYGNSLKVIH